MSYLFLPTWRIYSTRLTLLQTNGEKILLREAFKHGQPLEEIESKFSTYNTETIARDMAYRLLQRIIIQSR